jgi:hypothetical protein
MNEMNKINKYLNEGKKEINKALEEFKRSIREDHGEPLTKQEVKMIKTEIDRLAAGYKGM